MEYVSKITKEALHCGVAHIVPPPSWDPPFAVQQGMNGIPLEEFQFVVKQQQTSYLCRRQARHDAGSKGQCAAGDCATDDFGFVPCRHRIGLKSFSLYADWAKYLHFKEGSKRQCEGSSS